MVKLMRVFMILGGLLLTGNALAQQTFSYNGEVIQGGSTFDRPQESCAQLSGTVTSFEAVQIRVEVSGLYTITSQQTGFDGFLFVYNESDFNPGSPLNGCLAGDDDDADTRTSRITDVALLADVDYLVVMTGFNPDDAGTYENTIQGPGRSGIVTGMTFFFDSTTNERRISRAIQECDELSSNGPNTRFSSQVFSVSSTANYRITSEQTGFDGLIHVYDDTFNPLNPLQGCIAGDDDGPGGIGSSEINSVRLVAGRTYYLVTSGFTNNDAGDFVNTIFGPGVVFNEPGVFTLASLTGGWFDPGLNGSGFNIVAADVGIVFTFYGYIGGEQRWLLTNVISNEIRIGQQVSATLRIGDGGQLNNPGAANVETFGTLLFELIDCTTAAALIDGEGQFNGIEQFFDLRLLVQGTGPQCPQ